MGFREIDARGLSCPEPVVITKKALDKLEEGQLVVMVDAEVAKENVVRFVRSKGCNIKVEQLAGNEYKLIIDKST